MFSYTQEIQLDFLRGSFERRNASAYSFEEARKALLEFFALVQCSEGPLAVLGRPIDELWHTFILHTPQYRTFCQQTVGFFVEHQPHGNATPVPRMAMTNTVRAYEQVFGRQPGSIWFAGIDSSTEQKIREGIVPTEFPYEWSGWPGA